MMTYKKANLIFSMPTILAVLFSATSVSSATVIPVQIAFAQNDTKTTISENKGIPFVIQQTVQSMPDILAPNHQQYHQVAIALPDQLHGKVYAGTVTYTASQPLQLLVVQPFNASTIQNATGFPLGAGVGGYPESVAILHNEEGAFFGSENFAGSGLYFHSRSSQPFVVSYTIVGELVDPTPLGN